MYLIFCIFSLMTAPIVTKAQTVHSSQQVNTQQQIESDLAGITQLKLLVQEEITAIQKKIEEIITFVYIMSTSYL